MDKAIDIMNQYWGVYDTDYGPLLHISFNCILQLEIVIVSFFNAERSFFLSAFVFFGLDFCCYTDEELIRIAGIIANMEWKPLTLNFKNVTCNWDETEPDVVSLIVLVDDQTQRELASFVEHIEKQMIQQGTTHNIQHIHSIK